MNPALDLPAAYQYDVSIVRMCSGLDVALAFSMSVLSGGKIVPELQAMNSIRSPSLQSLWPPGAEGRCVQGYVPFEVPSNPTAISVDYSSDFGSSIQWEADQQFD
jgi:hypothetical protein